MGNIKGTFEIIEHEGQFFIQLIKDSETLPMGRGDFVPVPPELADNLCLAQPEPEWSES